MINRSYAGSLSVRVDNLKTEELHRVEKTNKLLNDLSNLLYVPEQYAMNGLMIGLILPSVFILVYIFVFLDVNPLSAEATPTVPPFIVELFTLLLTSAIGGFIGYRKGKSNKKRKMPELLQEAVFLGQQSPFCCNMMRIAFVQDDQLRKIQTPTLTNLFDLYQPEIDS